MYRLGRRMHPTNALRREDAQRQQLRYAKHRVKPDLRWQPPSHYVWQLYREICDHGRGLVLRPDPQSAFPREASFWGVTDTKPVNDIAAPILSLPDSKLFGIVKGKLNPMPNVTV